MQETGKRQNTKFRYYRESHLSRMQTWLLVLENPILGKCEIRGRRFYLCGLRNNR